MAVPNMQASDVEESFGAECQIERLLEDGALSVIIGGIPTVLEIAGLVPSKGGKQIPAEVIDRIVASNIPLRCRVVGPAGPNRRKAEFHYLAWHDKSGDVWEPLAELLKTGGQPNNESNGA